MLRIFFSNSRKVRPAFTFVSLTFWWNFFPFLQVFISSLWWRTGRHSYWRTDQCQTSILSKKILDVYCHGNAMQQLVWPISFLFFGLISFFWFENVALSCFWAVVIYTLIKVWEVQPPKSYSFNGIFWCSVGFPTAPRRRISLFPATGVVERFNSGRRPSGRLSAFFRRSWKTEREEEKADFYAKMAFNQKTYKCLIIFIYERSQLFLAVCNFVADFLSAFLERILNE